MALIDAIPGLAELRRTRDVVRRIRELPLEKKIQKGLLAEWFSAHNQAGIDLKTVRELLDLGVDLDEAKRILRRQGRREQYDQLLGREANKRFIG